MSMSFSTTESCTFSITNARYLASKIATDLKRMQRMYDLPTNSDIDAYEAEAIALLKAGYLKSATYGFKRDDSWVEPTVRYTHAELASLLATDDDPGRIYPGANINGARFGSFLDYTAAWFALTDAQRDAFKQTLPLARTTGTQPPINGRLVSDLSYTSGGQSLSRQTLRSL